MNSLISLQYKADALSRPAAREWIANDSILKSTSGEHLVLKILWFTVKQIIEIFNKFRVSLKHYCQNVPVSVNIELLDYFKFLHSLSPTLHW